MYQHTLQYIALQYSTVRLYGCMAVLLYGCMTVCNWVREWVIRLIECWDLYGIQVTLSHLKSFLESAVPPIRLFLMIIMMPLKRWVAEENYFTALLRNEARNELLMSGPWLSVAKLWLLLFTVARWRWPYLIFSSCNVKFPRQSWKWLISF